MSKTDPTVVYAEIQDWPGNRVGTDGSFWTKWRQVGRCTSKWELTRTWKKVKPWTSTGRGYATVTLHGFGKSKSVYVHHLVLEAFVGTRPIGMECLHKNDNRSDNNLSNLRWGTHQENVDDCVAKGRATGGSMPGQKNPFAKLTDEKIIQLRKDHATGKYSQRKLAAKYNISQPHVGRILRGEAWNHVSI